ncbi:MAG: diguanylate cyclase [Vallitaleaceae bacterium]|nr:diguanylate cyclase [Vallitaleaceae bacterium]
MKLDIQTLAFIQSLLFITQVMVLFLQYQMNRLYRGIGWWVLGSSVMAVGVLFIQMLQSKPLEILARFANPLIVLGQIFLYVGIMRFIDKKEKKWIIIPVYGIFLSVYYGFMFIDNSISGRTIVLYCILGVFSIGSAYRLFFNKDEFSSSVSKFTACIFLVYGCFSIVRVLVAILSPAIKTYSDQQAILTIGFIMPTIASTLWTFGFIIMVNQKLNKENYTEKVKMQQIFEASPDAAIITRLKDGKLIEVNEGFLAMTGYSYSEVVGKSALKPTLWHNIRDREHLVNELYKTGFVKNRECMFMQKDGSLFVGLVSARRIVIDGEDHAISLMQDITQRKKTEEAIKESEETYRSILNASPDNITITDLNGRILMTSPASNIMYGYEPDYVGFLGKDLLEYLLPEDHEKAKENLRRMRLEEHRRPNEYRGIRKDGSIFDIEVNSGFINNSKGKPIKMVFIVRDISKRKLDEQQIQLLVHQLEQERNVAQFNSITDDLTGIYNRRYFDEALKTEFLRLKRSRAVLSLIMLDVDHFKKYNDCNGHLAGDECLRRISAQLKAIVMRIPDIVARYGGEEFVVILPETEMEGATAMAQRIRKAVEALQVPHTSDEWIGNITVSLGVVTAYPSAMESPEQIIALADEALYAAKRAGRNRVEVASNLEQSAHY